MKAETETTQTPEQILNELRSLVSEAEKIVGHSPTGGCEMTMAALRERCEAAQARLAEFCANAKQKVQEGARYTDRAIREKPYQSLAVALGVGLLAGVWLGHRWGHPRE